MMHPVVTSHGDNYKVKEDFTVWVGQLYITVKKGFVSDGASVPQIFWSLGLDPFSPRTLAAALVHDILYKVRVLDRKTTDTIFYELLRIYHLSWFKAHVYYWGVRLGGWLPWMLVKKGDKKNLKYLQLVNNVL